MGVKSLLMPLALVFAAAGCTPDTSKVDAEALGATRPSDSKFRTIGSLSAQEQKQLLECFRDYKPSDKADESGTDRVNRTMEEAKEACAKKFNLDPNSIYPMRRLGP